MVAEAMSGHRRYGLAGDGDINVEFLHPK